jgi:hypothetical protein
MNNCPCDICKANKHVQSGGRGGRGRRGHGGRRDRGSQGGRGRGS